MPLFPLGVILASSLSGGWARHWGMRESCQGSSSSWRKYFFLLKETIPWKVSYKKRVSYDRHKLRLNKSPLRGEMS